MCSPEQRAELSSLRKARTDLLTGKMKTKARYGDKEVTYAATDMVELREAIRDLEAICPEQDGRARARRHGFVRPRL